MLNFDTEWFETSLETVGRSRELERGSRRVQKLLHRFPNWKLGRNETSDPRVVRFSKRTSSRYCRWDAEAALRGLRGGALRGPGRTRGRSGAARPSTRSPAKSPPHPDDQQPPARVCHETIFAKGFDFKRESLSRRVAHVVRRRPRRRPP